MYKDRGCNTKNKTVHRKWNGHESARDMPPINFRGRKNTRIQRVERVAHRDLLIRASSCFRRACCCATMPGSATSRKFFSGSSVWIRKGCSTPTLLAVRSEQRLKGRKAVTPAIPTAYPRPRGFSMRPFTGWFVRFSSSNSSQNSVALSFSVGFTTLREVQVVVPCIYAPRNPRRSRVNKVTGRVYEHLIRGIDGAVLVSRW